MAEIGLDKVTKVYADGTKAVSELDLEIADGEFVVFVGPSGCGKTTALRMIAGLEPITDGEVRIGDEVVNTLPPKDRDVAMVFQNYALYPHMSAYDNMAFALKMRGVEKAEIERRVTSAADTLGLSEVLKKKPRTLSGGQRQRVAMGRAIVREPQAFLMDEPLSNLDAKLRVEMRAEIQRLQRDLQVTTIYVTHDQVEAMTMGDRVCVMRGRVPPAGRLAPGALRAAGQPLRRRVHRLTGDEPRPGRPRGAERTGLGTVPLGQPDRAAVGDRCASGARRASRASEIIVGIRPEDLDDASLARFETSAVLPVQVDIREDMGAEVYAHFRLDADPVDSEEVLEAMEEEDVPGVVRERMRGGVPFIARLERGTRAREGDPLDVAVDTSRLHFFDPETGAGIY